MTLSSQNMILCFKLRVFIETLFNTYILLPFTFYRNKIYEHKQNMLVLGCQQLTTQLHEIQTLKAFCKPAAYCLAH